MWQSTVALSGSVHRLSARNQFWSIERIGRKTEGGFRPLAKSMELMASQDGKSQSTDRAKTGVLFVCLGNICRSPTAEAVFKSLVKERKMENRFIIDSCGTGGGNPEWYLKGGWSYHEGDPADDRMREAASKRNITITSASRPLTQSDLTKFDYLVAMDQSNIDDMKTAIQYWLQKDSSLNSILQKIVLMTDYCKNPKFKSLGKVPDPYYGGTAGFELVLDLLTDACDGLLEEIS